MVQCTSCVFLICVLSFSIQHAVTNHCTHQGCESAFLQVLRLPEGMTEALEDVARMAQRIWTSEQLYCVSGPPGGPPGGREFCSLLNYAIRSDNEALLVKVGTRWATPSL